MMTADMADVYHRVLMITNLYYMALEIIPSVINLFSSYFLISMT